MWCGCHGRAALAPLGHPRAGELDADQHDDPEERLGHARVREQQDEPSGLGDQDRDDVGLARRAAGRIVARRTRPLQDHRHPHHDVAGDHHAVVDGLALVDRFEHRGEAEREDHHADHLQHRGEPVDPVVGVVGRREPGEVDPRPGDRERAHREPEHGGLDVVLGQVVGHLVGRDPERDDEGQVEQQLERGRGPVRLVRVATLHAVATVMKREGHPPDAFRRAT